MVKGIRAHRGKETEYISQCLQEIQKEVTAKNMATKSMAILKLAYLTMFGYDMGWSTFAIVEVMSHNRFSTKRPGYLASAMSFNDSTDVGLLTINLFKKDFGGRSQYETGVAISCLSSICTPEICRDILGGPDSDVQFIQSIPSEEDRSLLLPGVPEGPAGTEDVLRRRPGCPDRQCQHVPGACKEERQELPVAGAAALSHPREHHQQLVLHQADEAVPVALPLGAAAAREAGGAPDEPPPHDEGSERGDGGDPLRAEGDAEGSAVAALALEKNQALLNSADRNLRFLALEMFKEVLDKPQFKDRIDMAELNAKVLTCIEESDTTARKLALQLLDRILSPATFAETVNHLLEFSKKTCSADEFFGTILRMGARDHYALVEEFEWYLVVLADAAKAAAQFSDLAARVVQVRPCAVTLALGLLDRSSGATDGSGAGAGAVGAGGVGGTGSASKEAVLDIAMPMVGACAWVIGEYHGDFESPAEASFLRAARALLSKTIQTLEPSVQTQCVWAAAKLYLGSPSLGSPALVSELHELLASRLPAFVRSTHVDVSERATIAMHLSAFFTGDARRVSSGRPLFEDPLLPVSPEAQGSLPVPEELGIDEPFFQQEGPPAEAFAPVRPDPADAYALAAAYKDDFGFLAAKEQAGQAASPQRTDARSSMFYLQPRGQQGGGDERAGAAPGDGNAEARPADPLEQMRERLQARAGGAKYQVLRDEVRAPGAPGPPPAGPNPTGSASSAPGTQLPPPPEKALAELQGRLWFLCCRDDHVGVYACVKAKNARKQLLRIELRCECVSGNSSGASVSGIKVRFPSAVAAQEADPEGSLSLVAGVLRERSAKVKVNLALTAFLAPLTCPLDCELHYTLACQGDAAAVAHRFDLCLPSTTFLLPAVMSEDDSLEFIKNHQPVMTERTVVLSAAGRSAESMHGDLPAIVGKCAGLCHFHCIQQEGAASQISSQKFLLTAQPPAGGHSALPGQVALPEGTRIMCLCRGLARDGALDLSVKVKACQKGICDDVASHLVRVFAELVEGRLRET
eukprot:CAMPEP_0175631360 /NCGR_PEP_ID=MMETSP0096-20121207/73475_1 /TAXON_ID=311494 /ORGANISM="Alexandrium monilatum, Strain CCMP3105" /LENGTH=1032 /DNA_ID=CAMNT_0016936787 /DNA_START=100 /DNA_END=3199 /DNA_ORIENTATION=-